MDDFDPAVDLLDVLDHEDMFNYSVNLEARCVVFDCGWIAPIVAMFDNEAEHTDEISEVVYVGVKLPEIGVVPLCVDDCFEDDEGWHQLH